MNPLMEIISEFLVFGSILSILVLAMKGATDSIQECERKMKIVAYKIGNRAHITIENATRRDMKKFARYMKMLCGTEGDVTYSQQPELKDTRQQAGEELLGADEEDEKHDHVYE